MVQAMLVEICVVQVMLNVMVCSVGLMYDLVLIGMRMSDHPSYLKMYET